ncbi:LOW QUALITY PROTEIN: Serine/threonine-protein kinase MARK2 [Plecturocebus cupreus]
MLTQTSRLQILVSATNSAFTNWVGSVAVTSGQQIPAFDGQNFKELAHHDGSMNDYEACAPGPPAILNHGVHGLQTGGHPEKYDEAVITYLLLEIRTARLSHDLKPPLSADLTHSGAPSPSQEVQVWSLLAPSSNVSATCLSHLSRLLYEDSEILSRIRRQGRKAEHNTAPTSPVFAWRGRNPLPALNSDLSINTKEEQEFLTWDKSQFGQNSTQNGNTSPTVLGLASWTLASRLYPLSPRSSARKSQSVSLQSPTRPQFRTPERAAGGGCPPDTAPPSVPAASLDPGHQRRGQSRAPGWDQVARPGGPTGTAPEMWPNGVTPDAPFGKGRGQQGAAGSFFTKFRFKFTDWTLSSKFAQKNLKEPESEDRAGHSDLTWGQHKQ